ncbi:MAG: hypothetical protein IKD54_10110 [Clostridia bacterium]|nr:hypothetical protein [Clostridia bacterium]
MEQVFDICGTRIPYKEIKDFRVVYREYIYRPLYREQLGTLKKIRGSKYVFSEMVPFASVLVADDKHYKLATKEAYAKTVGESIIKDMASLALSRIQSKAGRKKYHCQHISGRYFTVYLDDIPATLIRSDGKMSDVYENDSLYPLLGEPIAPAVLTVPTLKITTKNEEYLFYGNGIQLSDVNSAYVALGSKVDSMAALKESKDSKSFIDSVKQKIMLLGTKKEDTEKSNQ